MKPLLVTFTKKAITVSLSSGKDAIKKQSNTTHDLNSSFSFASGTSKADYSTKTYVKKSGQSWTINSSTGVVSIPSDGQTMTITVTYTGTKYANFTDDITITIDNPLTTGSGTSKLSWSGNDSRRNWSDANSYYNVL